MWKRWAHWDRWKMWGSELYDIAAKMWQEIEDKWEDIADVWNEMGALGPELVTNGTFTGSAAGWTLGAGGGTPDWYYDTNKVSHANGAAVDYLISPAFSVTNVAQYKLLFTISGYSAGTIEATVQNSDTYLDELGITGNGVKTYYFIPTQDDSGAFVALRPSGTFVGSIDDVSVKRIY